VTTRDLVLGHVSYVLLRLLAAGVAFATAAALFGAFSWLRGLAAVPLVVLCGLAYATPVMAFTGSLKHEGALAGLFRFGVVPMFLLSGTFFPLDQLPVWLQQVARAVPLWHAIELVRGVTLGITPTWPYSGHIAYLAVWLLIGTALALWVFRRRLVP
jgi:lipooligosaccharide transport system permease protein